MMASIAYAVIFFLGLFLGFVLCHIKALVREQSLRANLTVECAKKELLARQIAEQKQSEEQWQQRFRELSQKIYHEQQQQHIEEEKKQIENILKPMREQLDAFRHRIDSLREQDIKERTQLSEKIGQLAKLNQQMHHSAKSLTEALVGQSHTQGAWGEMILERVLEISGLQLGREYETQKVYKNVQGETLRPDVVISLPNNRHVVIDAKASLSAYYEYSQDNQETDSISLKKRQDYLKQHLESLNRHVKELSKREYHRMPELNGLDFVLMFIPIESALTVTANQQNDLFLKALNQRILIVTPNTLFVVLRIIHTQWQIEARSKNAEKIAAQGTKLYDQLTRFVDDFKKVGTAIENAQDKYQGAFNRLTTQRGNVIQYAKNLKEMGVSSTKEVDSLLN